MDLFSEQAVPINILPADGEALYYGQVLATNEIQRYYEHLFTDITWQHDEAFIYGKRITTKRKVAWYGDKPYDYTYSRTTKTALPFTTALMELKTITEKACNTSFNSCLLNLYHDGNEGMSWHSDDEKELGPNTVIASLSLGSERRFCFRHKTTGQKAEVLLENGSLLVMRGVTQSYWLHSLPKSVKVTRPRINLTFRTIRDTTL